MKNKLILTLVIMITVLGITFGQSKSRNLKVVIKTNIYCSHCKECESCGGRLTAGFAKIKGVKKYDLDDKKMNISVTFEPALVNIMTIKKAISMMGFDADEIKADPIAYDNLDGCCKK